MNKHKFFRKIFSYILTSIGGVCFLIFFIPTYFSLCNYYIRDARVFTSVFYQLTQGKALYTEVFDHKDPVFHYLYSIAFKLFEARGPMILETIISVGIILLIVFLLFKAKLFWVDRLSVLMFFLVLFFSPRVYYPIHTYHLAVLFFLISLFLSEYHLFFFSGMLFLLSVFTRFPMAAFLPALLFYKIPVQYLFQANTRILALKPLSQKVLGSMLGSLLVIFVMILRGEFSGYIDVLKINFSYSKNLPLVVAEITKFPSLLVHLRDIYSPILVNFWLVISIVNVLLLAYYFLQTVLRDRLPLINKLMTRQYFFSDVVLYESFFQYPTFSLLLSIAMAVILGNASFWNHYYQACGLVVAMNLIPLFKIKKELMDDHKWASMILSLVLFFMSSGLVVSSGLTGDLQLQSLENYSLNSCPAQVDPVMSECLFGEPTAKSMTYTTISQPNYGMIAAYNPVNYSFECRLFYQLSFFGSLIDNYKSCLFIIKPDLIIRAPYGLSIPDLEVPLNMFLDLNYIYTHNCEDFQIYIRKP